MDTASFPNGHGAAGDLGERVGKQSSVSSIAARHGSVLRLVAASVGRKAGGEESIRRPLIDQWPGFI
jgi:hypothetical protein